MEANLPADTPAGDEPTGKTKWASGFPFSNWGPLAAVLGVLLAIGTGIVVGVPAIVLGSQSGGVEAFPFPGLGGGETIDDVDSYGVVEPSGYTIFSDRGDEVAILSPGVNDDSGDQVVETFGDFDESRGIAAGPGDRVYVADRGSGEISVFRDTIDPKLVDSFDGSDLVGAAAEEFEPERVAVGPDGEVYVLDAGNGTVEQFSPRGRYIGEIDGSAAPSGGFEFEDAGEETGLAIAPGRRGAIVYVVGDQPDGGSAVWAFDDGGRPLWELPGSGSFDPCGVTLDHRGRLWISDAGDGAERYALSPRANRRPIPTGQRVAAGAEACSIAFGSRAGWVYAASAPALLTTTAAILVQLATALGFLLVPFAIAAGRGATVRQGARRLGLRRFRLSALKWMAAAIGAYLLFAFVYVAIVGQPEQEDIAEGFGTIPIQVLLIVVAAPISEEICFRGMLFGGLRERFPRIVAALISGVIFGALHALTGISAVPPLIAFGFILALLYERTGSVVPGIILHMLNNSVALLGQ